MIYPYQATIEGTTREIAGMDADGKYLVDGGEKLWIKPLQERETFRAVKLISVSKLTFTGDEWLLDGKNVKSLCVSATINRRESSGEAHTQLSSLVRLLEMLGVGMLGGLSDEDRAEIKGVALFEELHEAVEGETAENCAVTEEGLPSGPTMIAPEKEGLPTVIKVVSYVKRLPVPPAKAFRPVLLTDYQVIPPGVEGHQHAIIKSVLDTGIGALEVAGERTVKKIRAANLELQGGAAQLDAAVGRLSDSLQPVREMYKDQRLAGVKADALNAGIPELVVDVIVSEFHASRFPTVGVLQKRLNDSGIATKLEAEGHGTSNQTFSRWLGKVRDLMYRHGQMQRSQISRPSSDQIPAVNSAADDGQTGSAPADTRSQELPEGHEE